jgi:hypothetical protein
MTLLKKTPITIMLFLIVIITTKAQNVDEYPCISRREIIGTQGRQEDRQAKRLIRKEYKKQSYDRYSGSIIIINEDTFKYDDEVLFIFNTCKDLKPIFQKGIFYPEIITGPVKKGLARKKELDATIFRNDSLRISDFQELKFLRRTPQAKIYRFWIYSKGMFNPTVCFIELTNDSATIKTDRETFINGSKLTFFKEGWLIL